MSVLRVGFVGCGHVVAERHLPALRRTPAWRAVALHDTDGERMRRVADRFGIQRRHARLEDLLDGVDAVAVCTPADAHVEPTLLALARGIPVLIEKPLALDLASGDRIVAAAASARVPVVVGFNLRAHAGVERARAVVADGLLGELELVRTVFTSPIRRRGAMPPWRRVRVRGGGVLIETAVHHFDLWRHLAGSEIDAVSASSVADGEDDDVRATIAGRLSNGVFASSSFAQATVDTFVLELWGTAGALRVDGHRGSFELRRSNASRAARALAAVRGLAAPLVAWRAGDLVGSSFANQWRAFAAVVRGEREAAPTVADGCAALRAVLAATASASQRREVRLADAPSTIVDGA